MSEEHLPLPEPSQPATPALEENSQETAPAHEKEIDLNVLFPDTENDLNTLFQDEDMKLLLKSVSKNKKDLHTLKDRFLEENETEDATEDLPET